MILFYCLFVTYPIFFHDTRHIFRIQIGNIVIIFKRRDISECRIAKPSRHIPQIILITFYIPFSSPPTQIGIIRLYIERSRCNIIMSIIALAAHRFIVLLPNVFRFFFRQPLSVCFSDFIQIFFIPSSWRSRADRILYPDIIYQTIYFLL